MKLTIIIIIYSWVITMYGQTMDICSRNASINYQDVPIDISPKRGEGLRYYLTKSPMAKKYLDQYQNETAPKWYSAIIGTVGTSLLIGGIGYPGSLQKSGLTKKRLLVVSGAAIIFLNYLVVKTMEYNNERLLSRAIEKYNENNLPRIYFSPYIGPNNEKSTGVSAGIMKEF